MQVKVQKNQVERALRTLKKKLIREGVFKELSKRRFHSKPSIKSKIKREEADKRRARNRKRKQGNIFQ